MQLQRSQAGWNWKTLANVPVAFDPAGQLEVSIPRSDLQLAGDILHFKWCDNVDVAGDALRFYTEGDSAPNARFTYSFRFPNLQNP